MELMLGGQNAVDHTLGALGLGVTFSTDHLLAKMIVGYRFGGK